MLGLLGSFGLLGDPVAVGLPLLGDCPGLAVGVTTGSGLVGAGVALAAVLVAKMFPTLWRAYGGSKMPNWSKEHDA